MGCWDIFCSLCGNPCHGMFKESSDTFLEYIHEYEKIKDSKRKAELKILCNYYVKNPNFIKKIKEYEKTTKWMNKCTFLTVQNKVIHNCKEISCNIYFGAYLAKQDPQGKAGAYLAKQDPQGKAGDKNKNYYTHIEKDGLLNENSGIFVHTDCWKYVKTKFNISLNYSYLPIIEPSVLKNKIFSFIKYFCEKYWDQSYNFYLALLENSNLLLSPKNTSSIARKQIQKVITGLKIRDDKTRKSPINSASFYKSNTYKIGQDKNIWFIKGGKWIQLKEETNKINIVLNKKNNKLAKKLVFIGETNNIPAFITNIQSSNKEIKLEILSTNIIH